MSVIDVVAEYQTDCVVADEILADEEGLGQSLRLGLHFVGQVDSELRAVAEQFFEPGQIVWCGYDENIPDVWPA